MKSLKGLCSVTNSLLLLAACLPFDQRFYIFFSRFSSYSNQNQPCIKAAQLALLGVLLQVLTKHEIQKI